MKNKNILSSPQDNANVNQQQPATNAANQQSSANLRRIVSGCCDNCVRIWSNDHSKDNQGNEKWIEVKFIEDNKHNDWVYSVAWAPSVGLSTNLIASCSEDHTVSIWNELQNGRWKRYNLATFNEKVWSVSWSLMGNILAISHGDKHVSLWKQSLDGNWQNLTKLKENTENVGVVGSNQVKSLQQPNKTTNALPPQKPMVLVLLHNHNHKLNNLDNNKLLQVPTTTTTTTSYSSSSSTTTSSAI